MRAGHRGLRLRAEPVGARGFRVREDPVAPFLMGARAVGRFVRTGCMLRMGAPPIGRTACGPARVLGL